MVSKVQDNFETKKKELSYSVKLLQFLHYLSTALQELYPLEDSWNILQE